MQLRSWDQVQRQSAAKGRLIVILDDATESHFHSPTCDDVAERHFDIERGNRWKNGAYYWVSTPSQAAGYATACSNCGGQPVNS